MAYSWPGPEQGDRRDQIRTIPEIVKDLIRKRDSEEQTDES